LFKNTFSFSIIFQHEIVGEFWYKLNLLAEQPEPKHLPTIDSELGRFGSFFLDYTIGGFSIVQLIFSINVETTN
jgi:hypothetical protein